MLMFCGPSELSLITWTQQLSLATLKTMRLCLVTFQPLRESAAALRCRWTFTLSLHCEHPA